MQFKILFTLILIVQLVGLKCNSQNLVANSSFEDVNICSELNAPCSPSAWKTTSPFLLQYGGNISNKYVGITIFNTSIPETRMYLQNKLLCPLVKNKLYRFSIKVRPNDVQIESIGVMFSDSIVFFNRDILVKRKPSIELTISRAKTTNRNKNTWTRLEADYRAKGNEKYFIIGNFQTDSEQKRKFFSKPKNFTNYSYDIDDFELSPVDNIEVCSEYEANREKLYSLKDRHPLKRNNLFGDDNPPSIEIENIPVFDTIRIGNVFFEFDSYKIDSLGKVSLDSLFSHLNKDNIDSIKVFGHTDSIGNKEYNMDLSYKRANTIRQILIENNLGNYTTEVRGFGDQVPIESNFEESGRIKNRRVEVIIKYKANNKSTIDTH
jgi:outer membrane protein OmpA-like peptidoglycan-associated protein